MIVGGANTAEWHFGEEALQVSWWPLLYDLHSFEAA